MSDIKIDQGDFTANCDEECFIDLIESTTSQFNIEIPENVSIIQPYSADDLLLEFKNMFKSWFFTNTFGLINPEDIKIEKFQSEIRFRFHYNMIIVKLKGLNVEVHRPYFSDNNIYTKNEYGSYTSFYLLPNTVNDLIEHVLKLLLYNPYLTNISDSRLRTVQDCTDPQSFINEDNSMFFRIRADLYRDRLLKIYYPALLTNENEGWYYGSPGYKHIEPDKMYCVIQHLFFSPGRDMRNQYDISIFDLNTEANSMLKIMVDTASNYSKEPQSIFYVYLTNSKGDIISNKALFFNNEKIHNYNYEYKPYREDYEIL